MAHTFPTVQAGLVPMSQHARRLLRLVVLVGLLAGCSPPWGPRFTPSGLADRVVLALLVDPAGVLYAGTSAGIYRSIDAGRGWQPVSGLPDGTAVPGLGRGPAGLYAATGRGPFTSADGQTWQPLGTGLPGDVALLSVAPDGAVPQRVLVGTGRRGIYLTTDGGASWQPASAGFPRGDLPVYVIAADPTRPARLLAGTIGAGLFRSDDGAASWQAVGGGFPPTTNVFAIAGSPAGWLLVGTSVGLFRSDDGGQNWRWSRDTLGHTRVIALARDPATAERLVAGADDGVYRSADAGRTWRKLAEGLPADEHVGAVALVGGRIVVGAGPAWARDDV
jgi:photosystem II stability/assembly factor-like uncharacterized protein